MPAGNLGKWAAMLAATLALVVSGMAAHDRNSQLPYGAVPRTTVADNPRGARVPFEFVDSVDWSKLEPKADEVAALERGYTGRLLQPDLLAETKRWFPIVLSVTPRSPPANVKAASKVLAPNGFDPERREVVVL